MMTVGIVGAMAQEVENISRLDDETRSGGMRGLPNF